MKNRTPILVLLMFLISSKAWSQYSLHIIATLPPGTKETYVVGSFNNWKMADQTYPLTSINENHKEVTLHNLKEGNYQFKFTRGSQLTLECDANGVGINNREINLNRDTTVSFSIAAWNDEYFDLSNLTDSLLYEAMMSRAGYYAAINLDSSYKYALHLYDVSKNLSPMKQARALDLQAAIFTQQGNGEKALGLLFKSLEIKKTFTDSSSTAFVYGKIGEIYESQQDFANAKENYLQSAKWSTMTYPAHKSVCLVNVGSMYLKEGKPDSANSYAVKALALDNNSARALMLMGDIKRNNGNNKSALEYYKKAITLNVFVAPGSPLYMNNAEAYKKMAEVFYIINAKDSSLFYARKAYTIATNTKNPLAVVGSGNVLINLFKDDHKFDSAFFYQQIVTGKKDSLFTAEKEKQIHNIYFNEKLQQQEHDAQTQQYNSQVKIYILAALAILLLLAGIGYRAWIRTRFYKRLSEIEMRALRAQMNPHFIFNCLASINRYIVISDTKTASAYLTKFSKLIRLILDNSANEFVSVDAELQTLKLYLDMETLRFEDSFDYEIEHATIARTDNTALPTMVIQPYIENAIWHGLLHKEVKGKLWIRFIQLNEDVLQVEIKDNGIGRKKAAELRSKDSMKTKSYGMQISKERIEIINKQYRIKSSVVIEDLYDANKNAVGTKVTLHLPLIEMAAAIHSTKQNL